jgi:hypothetical protein
MHRVLSPEVYLLRVHCSIVTLFHLKKDGQLRGVVTTLQDYLEEIMTLVGQPDL